MNKTSSFFMPITKRDEDQRMVYGYASTEALDSDGEIITKEAMEGAIDDYMKFGAVREMHQAWSAGRTKEADFDDKGLYIGVKIVDDQAWEKIKEGVYNGFSVGGEALAKIGNKITQMVLKEISLVDRPANPECLYEVFKMDSKAPNPNGEKTMSEEIKKGEDSEIAERKTAMKGALADRMKAYKTCMEDMQSAHDGLDDATKEAMDSFDDKLTNLWPIAGQTHKAEADPEHGETAEEEDAEEDMETEKLEKSLSKIVDLAVAKALKIAKPIAKAEVKPESEISKLQKLVIGLTEKLEKMETTPTAPRSLRTISKDDKVDIIKIAKDEPKKLEEMIAKGEITRSEAFKQVLAGSARQIIN